MSALARPAVLAALLTAAALCLHPALSAAAWLPEPALVLAALLLASLAGLVSAAFAAPREKRAASAVVAAGALVAVLALGLDGVRGRHGTLELGVGQGRSTFEEIGPGGRRLGLRPFGLVVGVDRVTAAGGVVLAVAGAPAGLEVTTSRAAAASGFRFARPRLTATGGAARLRVAISDGSRTGVAELAPGKPARAGELVVSLAEYFPDFALDERQQPFTRSLEPRNPAALLHVERGGQTHRAFVIQSMPGLHRVEPLGLAFSLLQVVPEQRVELSVHREPFAPALLLAALLLALGVGLGAWLPRPLAAAPGPSAGGPVAAAQGPLDPALPAGAAYLLALLLAGGWRLLAWSFAVPSASGPAVELAGVGLFLGLSLVAAAGGTLWLGAAAVAGQPAPRAPGRGGLWLAVSTGAAGLLLAAARLSTASEAARPSLLPPAGLALTLAALGLVLWRGRPAWLLPAAVVLSVAVTAAAGVRSTVDAGSYASPAVLAGGATTLLGLAALLPAGLPVRRLSFYVSLVALLVRPS